MAAAASSGCTAPWPRTAPGRRTSSSTSSATTSPALADEYYTSDVAYLPARRSRRAVGAERHGAARSRALKWKDLVDARHAAADAVAERGVRAATRNEIQQRRRADPRGEPAGSRDGRAVPGGARVRDRAARRGPYAGKVGAFEGANYEARGFFRPQADCIMFTRDQVPFCAVCRRAIGRVLGSLQPVTWLKKAWTTATPCPLCPRSWKVFVSLDAGSGLRQTSGPIFFFLDWKAHHG